MRRLIKNPGAGPISQASQDLAPCRRFGRQKAVKTPVPFYPGNGQDGRHSTRSGQRSNNETCLPYGLHNACAGIGDARRSGIRDQRHAIARSQSGNNSRRCLAFVVFAAGQQRNPNPVGGQQGPRDPRILRCNQCHATQYIQGAQADVAPVANWRCYDIQCRRSGGLSIIGHHKDGGKQEWQQGEA